MSNKGDEYLNDNIQILVIEDNMLIGAKISMLLENLKYKVIGLIPRAEDALIFLKNNTPDIILLDIKLKGKMDGVEFAHHIESQEIPIIYLTANTDDATFKRAKETRPYAFISKPYKRMDLQRAVELTLSLIHKSGSNKPKISTGPVSVPHLLSDRIFVRHKDHMIKIFIKDIMYVSAERNYSRIFTDQKEYLLALTLKNIDEKLPESMFFRIHRSFIINISRLNEIGERYVVIDQKTIPIGRQQKEELMSRINKL